MCGTLKPVKEEKKISKTLPRDINEDNHIDIIFCLFGLYALKSISKLLQYNKNNANLLFSENDYLQKLFKYFFSLIIFNFFLIEWLFNLQYLTNIKVFHN